ncbi:hypothetical protein YQE_12366, partial [Dendroctonus ponderosae]
MPMDSQKEHIQVSVRSRPLLSETSSLQLISKDPPVLLLPERSQTYQFDNVFLEDADQQKVYNDAVRPLVNLVKLGYNCTVFAYGQTGTGKTYTMGSGSQGRYGNIETRSNQAFIPKTKIFFHTRNFLTTNNPCSSEEVFGKLNLVDLAGSESVKKTGSKGGTFQEGININKGLLCIGQVISALSARSSYIPYRESTITSILKGMFLIYIHREKIKPPISESLNIDNYISLIACVSADPEDITETLQTLDFAQRTKRIRCNPEVVAKFKKDNPERLIQGRTPMSLIQGRTPMKRWKTPLKTPISRSLGMTLLPLINERDSEISHAEVSLSIDLSAKKTAITDVQQMLRITWGKIQDTVTKMVYSEVAQLMQKPARAASSPIDDNHNTFPNKILFRDESLDSPAIENPLHDLAQKDFSFKIPLKPAPLVKTQNDISRNSVRRSSRLALKHQANQSVDLMKSDWWFDSVITSSKRKKTEEDTLTEVMKSTPIFNNDNGHKTNTGTRRKSMRLKAQKCNEKYHRKSAHVAFENGVKVAQPRNPKELGGETAIRWAEDCRANSNV